MDRNVAVAERDEDGDEFEEIIKKVQKIKHPTIEGRYYYLYNGFWITDSLFKGVISFQKHYVANDDDIVLASCPKSGTTWLKALTFTITNRSHFTLSNTPLLVSNPHDLVPEISFIDLHTLDDDHNKSSQRLFSTHNAYSLLPHSIKNSKCKIVYICRNPLDLFVSLWHFSQKFSGSKIEPSSFELYFDNFSQGIHAFGPFWNHVLEFWKASQELPHKILFLKFEDLKKDNVFFIKKLADFLGFPFSLEEEQQGLIEEISKFCSIDRMKSFEINKVGKNDPMSIPNSSFFRKGKVGDWRNFLTPQMVERGKKLIQEKFKDSNITFDFE
ncbi:flavonol 3-sulfotransferase-like [Humulus lupulus]|uniref:flavonol 3-sulfotransferase-like n=1 Tax=Humulus lupulus TaxID=3486 RepID=UPI002B40C0BE|nr:flavonol 3-sulfotransferase-like [Humulus lupulus]